jgi:hypothetical protein
MLSQTALGVAVSSEADVVLGADVAAIGTVERHEK